MGYILGIQSIPGAIGSLDNYFLGNDLTPVVAPKVSNYLQQNVTNVAPTLDSYLAAGVLLAIGGFILVARGDPKPKSAQEA